MWIRLHSEGKERLVNTDNVIKIIPTSGRGNSLVVYNCESESEWVDEDIAEIEGKINKQLEEEFETRRAVRNIEISLGHIARRGRQ